MTLIYTTREGAKWVVNGCKPHFQCPDFWVGRREDGVQVTLHRHRCEVRHDGAAAVSCVTTQSAGAAEGNAS